MMKRMRHLHLACAAAVLALGIACGDEKDKSGANGPSVDSPVPDADGGSLSEAGTPADDAGSSPDGAASADANGNDARPASPNPPATTGGSIEVELGETVTGTLTATDPDGDALTYSITTPPAHGTLTLDPNTGAYSYTSTGTNTLPDSFFFQVSDGTSNAPSPGKISVKITPILFTGNYSVTSVTDNGATCSGGTMRLGHATAVGASPAYFALSSRSFSCGSTTYTFEPVRLTVGGSTTITDTTLAFTQGKSVSGCGWVTETFSLARSGTGDFDISEKIEVPCFGVGTHVLAGKAKRAPAAYLFLEPESIAFGRVFQNDSAIKTVNLRNVGRLDASTVAVSSPAAPFSFDGGAYPGTGGTCGTTLSALSSCSLTFGLDSTALSPSSSSGTAQASYLDGAATYYDSLSLSGQVIPKLTSVTEVAAANNYQCAIDSGKVVCWGSGANAPPNDLVNPRKLSAGYSFTCAIDDSGVRCWGSNTYGQLTPPALSNPTRVSAGGSHACALDDTGVHCWGLNTSGQTTVPALTNPKLVSAGGTHTCALDDTGVHCWGLNTSGQTTVPALTNPTVVSAGNQYTCALDATGVHCWGNTFANQTTPPAIVSPTTVVAGGHLSCAVAGASNALTCWGFFSSGVPKLTSVSQVSTGDHHVCALQGSSMFCYSGSSQIYP
jgi:hypothetical protein